MEQGSFDCNIYTKTIFDRGQAELISVKHDGYYDLCMEVTALSFMIENNLV